MAKLPQFEDQLRNAIDASGMTRRSIAQAIGVDEGNFSKFMAGTIGLSMASINEICVLLGLDLVQRKTSKPAKAKPKR